MAQAVDHSVEATISPPRCASAGESAVQIGIVGAGPRGTIALDRIVASADEIAPATSITVHLIDPEEPGAGRVFRTCQSRNLLMNTVSSDVTVFTDRSMRCSGPIRPGPSQYEWARLVAAGTITEDITPDVAAEAQQMQPWSYASRAFNGHYLSWAFRHVTDSAPARVTVVVHRCAAVAADTLADGRQLVRLDDGESLALDSVVLTTGHSDVVLTPGQRRTRDFAFRGGLCYIPPASPAEVDLSVIEPGEPVLLRGMGLTFFDYVALLTAGRGGSFHRSGGELSYLPSGLEPVMWGGSRRGTPHAARPEIRQDVPTKYRPRFLTDEVVAELRRDSGTGRTDFYRQLWPYIVKELQWVYYSHLLASDRERWQRFRAAYADLDPGSPEMAAVIADHVPDPALRWDWRRIDRPSGDQRFCDHGHYTRWVRRRLQDDFVHSLLGPNDSAVKVVAATLRDLRAPISRVVSHQGLSGSSYRSHVVDWFNGFFNSVANGPPAFRVEELTALIDAGVMRFVGPEMRVTEEPSANAFLASSPAVEARPVRARVFIDARLHDTDLRRTANPLLASLAHTGQCRPHVIPDRDDDGYRTGGLDITEGTQQLIDSSGRPHHARFAYGPPVEFVQWLTATIARPFSNSSTLLQGDLIARQALTVGVRAHASRGQRFIRG